jgi:hypothetical protein
MFEFFLQNFFGQGKGGVDGFKPVFRGVLIEQRKRRDSEKCVKDVRGVSGPIRDAALAVLASQNEILQVALVDEGLPLDHPQSGVNPPGVANVGQFFGPPVEAALRSLSFAQPVGQVILVELVQSVGDLQGPYAAKNVGAVALCLWLPAEPALKINHFILRQNFCILKCIEWLFSSLFYRGGLRVRGKTEHSRKIESLLRPAA